MIIFNLNAIAVGIIIAVICGPIYWLMPDHFANSPLGMIILASIATVLAGLSELGGLKGRLFFLPMWLLGILGTIAFTYFEFGWTGIGILGGGLVLVFALLFLLVYLSEKSDWNNAYQHFTALKKMKDLNTKAFWEQVEKAKFFPSMMSNTHRMCQHNLEVLLYMKAAGVDWEEIEALIPVFHESSIQGNEIQVDSELTDAFEARLAEVLAGYEENTQEE